MSNVKLCPALLDNALLTICILVIRSNYLKLSELDSFKVEVAGHIAANSFFHRHHNWKNFVFLENIFDNNLC